MRMNDGRAIPAFMSQAMKNEDVTVFGGGSQTRLVSVMFRVSSMAFTAL
jgi:hypothetical protein